MVSVAMVTSIGKRSGSFQGNWPSRLIWTWLLWMSLSMLEVMIFRVLRFEKMTLRLDRVWGQMGVMAKALAPGWMMGPPAERL